MHTNADMIARTTSYTHIDHTQKCTTPRGNHTAAGSAHVGQLTDNCPTSTNVYGQIESRREGQTYTFLKARLRKTSSLYLSFLPQGHENITTDKVQNVQKQRKHTE